MTKKTASLPRKCVSATLSQLPPKSRKRTFPANSFMRVGIETNDSLAIKSLFFFIRCKTNMRVSVIVLLCLGVLGVCSGFQLYGESPVTLTIETISSVTSNVTQIGNPDKSQWPRDEKAAKYKSAIDPVRKIYYVAAYNKTSEVMSLRGMSLSTGNVVNEIVLPFKPTPFETYVLSLDYKPSTDSLLVSGSEVGTGRDHSLYSVSLSDNKVHKISNLPTLYEVLSGNPACYDSDNDLVWAVLAPSQNAGTMDLYAFSASSGNEVHHFVDVGNFSSIHALQYSPKLQTLVACSQTRGLVPTLINIKPATGAVIIIGKYPQYSFVVLDNACAIDKEGNFYTYQTPDSSETYYQLVTFAPDGTVLNEPKACDEINYCPLNIAGLDD